MKAKKSYGTMACTQCGEETPRRHPLQRYCPKCSEERNKVRQKNYSLRRGQADFERGLGEQRAKWQTRGIELSKTERLSLLRSLPEPPNLHWYNRIAVPFTWSGSKNHIFSSTGRGHTFMRDESRYYRALITEKILASVKDPSIIKQNKLWIDIFVQKPTHRGDAANFLDLVCDAIKDAIPLDDRWYSVRSIDWQITKHEPMIYIGLGQEEVDDVQACSCCGRLLTFENFQKNRHAKAGVGRVCKDCMRVDRTRRKKADPAALNEGVFA